MRESIKEGFMVFASDGDEGIGAVREVMQHQPPELLIYIENAGDFVVPLTAVESVHSDKVVLNCKRLDPRIREAINHARDAEDPNYVPRFSDDAEPESESE